MKRIFTLIVVSVLYVYSILAQGTATVIFSDKPADIDLTAAVFTFVNASGVETDVSASKIDPVKFDVVLPETGLKLRKVLFQTSAAADSRFEYYFPPQQELIAEEQTISIAPPSLLSYWQGGMIMTINETLPLTGTARYNISGAVMAPVVGTKTDGAKLPWFPNSTDVTGAMSTTDGVANTAAIIKALGGPGTTPGFAARFAYWLRSGGYADWYLPVADEYLIFNTLWKQDTTLFKQKMYEYGNTTLNTGTHKQFWTSENINATQTKLFDIRNGGYIAPGIKVYGLYCFAFRKFEYVDKGPTTLASGSLDDENVIVSVNSMTLYVKNILPNTILKIYELTGENVMTKVVNDNCSVTLSNKGIYLINLENEGSFITRKVAIY